MRSWPARRRWWRSGCRAPAYLGAVVAAVLLAGYGFAAWRSLDYARAGTAYSNPEISQLAAFGDAGSQGLGVGLVFDDLAKTELRTLVQPSSS